MEDWKYAQSQPSDDLARLPHFSMKKVQDGREIEFVITIREKIVDQDQSMKFFAQADKQTNQRTAPFTPFGWGSDLLTALTECVRSVHLFPYEGSEVEKDEPK